MLHLLLHLLLLLLLPLICLSGKYFHISRSIHICK